MRAQSMLLPFAAILLTLGCSGTPVRIATLPVQPNEEVIGPVTGSSTGVMLFQFIPLGQNDRFGTAYQRALLSASGATRIVDVTIEEDWLWLLNTYNFTLTGTAVRAK